MSAVGWLLGKLDERYEKLLIRANHFACLLADLGFGTNCEVHPSINSECDQCAIGIQKLNFDNDCFECGDPISQPGHVVDGKLTCGGDQ